MWGERSLYVDPQTRTRLQEQPMRANKFFETTNGS